MFFINIVPGIIVTIAAITLIDFDQPDLTLFERFDWVGLISMALFLGALEYVLEDGPRYDWFEDSTIALAAVVSAAAAAVIFPPRAHGRAADRRSARLRRSQFRLGSVFSFVLGIGLYGLTYLYPIYLGQIRGHNALMIGETMFVSGVDDVSLRADRRPAGDAARSAPDADRGLRHRRAQQLADELHHKDWDFWQLFVPQILRGFGMMLAIVPITNISLGTLPPDRLKNASGLFNLTRNLGGAVGLAALNTVFDKRIDLHLARLHDSITWNRPSVLEALNAFAARIPGSDAQAMALKELFVFTRSRES